MVLKLPALSCFGHSLYKGRFIFPKHNGGGKSKKLLKIGLLADN